MALIQKNESFDYKLASSILTSKRVIEDSIVRFVWKNEKDYPVEFVSENVERVFGYSSNDFIKSKIVYSEIIFPEDLERVVREIKTQINGEFTNIGHNPYRVICKSGKVKWVNDITIKKRDESDNVTHFEGVITDITEECEKEKALKESEEKFRIIADYTYDWEYWVSPERDFVYSSPSCERITGYSAEEFMQDSQLLERIILPEDIEIVKKHRKDYSENNISLPIDFRIVTKSGEIRWINHLCNNVYNSSGENIGRRGSNRDITDRKKVEKILEENREKMRETILAKDKFFSIIAHDLKGPFNSMLGFSELLNDNFDDYDRCEHKRFINIIYNGIENTLKLLDNLLQWSRSQNGTIDFYVEKINLFQIAEETIRLLKQCAKDKSINLVNYINEDIFVVADKEMLSTIIRNLLSNAIKFTNSDGEVSIKTSSVCQKDSFVEMVVSDNGVGISEIVQPKLFDIGENISTEGTHKERGTGLGLLLCDEFVKKHGGNIWLKSVLGKGSSFYFTIPNSL